MRNISIPTRVRRMSSAAMTTTLSRDSSEDGNSIISTMHPMLRMRKRSLTIPLAEPIKIGRVRKRYQETSDQLQSQLFSALPLEIRLIIWEMVLGGFDIHIFGWARKLGHLICCSDGRSPEGVRRVCMGPVDAGNNHGVLHRAPYKFLSLLLTCRRIYSEAVKLIYSLNTFHFVNYRYRMSRVFQRVLPHRWNSIRHLYLNYYQPRQSNFQMPTFIEGWGLQCSVLANMPNIHKLVIVLASPQNSSSEETESDELVRSMYMSFLQPLKSIRTHGIFEVYLPYSTDDGLNKAFFPNEIVPFRLRQLPERILRFHEEQANDIPIDQAVRAFDY